MHSLYIYNSYNYCLSSRILGLLVPIDKNFQVKNVFILFDTKMYNNIATIKTNLFVQVYSS